MAKSSHVKSVYKSREKFPHTENKKYGDSAVDGKTVDSDTPHVSKHCRTKKKRVKILSQKEQIVEQIVIRQLSRNEKLAWNDFVARHDGCTIFYTLAWKQMLEKFRNYHPTYLYAVKNNRMAGVLPLFFIKHMFWGKKLISIPFGVYGGVCAESKAVATKLVAHAIDLAQSLDVDYLELRHREPVEGDLQTISHYSTFLLDLNQNIEHLWKNIRKSNRRAVKKARTEGLKVDLTYDDADAFYDFYARDQHRFGTPILDRSWIHHLMTMFPENHSISRVHLNGKTIAMFMVRRYKNTVSEVIGNDLPEYRALNPNLLLEWTLIEDACKKGYKWYDFGRSTQGSGPYFFKLGWGAHPVALHYQFYMNNGKKIIDTSHSNPKRQLFAQIWKWMPLPLVNQIGPMVRRHFP